MILGSTPIPASDNCILQFHQYKIYDSVEWLQDGYLCWSAADKQFYVEPFVPNPPVPGNTLPGGVIPINKTGIKKKISELKK